MRRDGTGRRTDEMCVFIFIAAIGSRGEQARGASRPTLVVRRVLGSLRSGACTFSRGFFFSFCCFGFPKENQKV